jgi:hypothetical protein
MAGMRGFAPAAGMRRHSCGRQHKRSEASDKREKQQKSGCQAMHALSVKQNPK